jgi:hypothetical protein
MEAQTSCLAKQKVENKGIKESLAVRVNKTEMASM